MSKNSQWIVGVNAVASSIEKDPDNVREVLIEAGSQPGTNMSYSVSYIEAPCGGSASCVVASITSCVISHSRIHEYRPIWSM